jgi:IS30 family transposase
MRYRRVDMIDRCHIEYLKGEGKNQKQIADILNFHPSTISRELRRKDSRRNGRYCYGRAQDASEALLVHRLMPRKLKGRVLAYVLEKLGHCWSPDQISSRMQIDLGLSISHETIYRFIKRDKDEGGILYLLLRRGRRKRKNRFPSMKRIAKRDLLPTIDERAKQIENRSRFGDWERDTMFGSSRKKAILVLLERKSRLVRLRKLDARKARTVSQMTAELTKGFPLLSITNDRGSEFLDYEELNRRVPVYFCHPYTSQERGSVENSIGLLRQYLPKHFDIESLTDEELNKIETELNARPRKTLGYKTPAEVISETKVALCG